MTDFQPTHTIIQNGQGEIQDTNPLPVVAREWGITKFDPNTSAPIYVGYNLAENAADTDTDWVVLKYTYSGSDITIIQRKVGAWSNRASLFS